MENTKNRNTINLILGAVIGVIAALLVHFGNPGNMGFCLACFWRDITGALGLHSAGPVKYLRPEVIGFVLGAFISSMAAGEFKSRGGSSPITRFTLGFTSMIGALVFLGCPLRLILRLGGGDLNALVGFAGFAVGILIGIYFLKKGFSLGRAYSQPKVAGYFMPAFVIILLVFLIAKPEFIGFSEEGPGSKHAPIIMSLVAGLIVGAIFQKRRLCTAGAIRDIFLVKDYGLFMGAFGIFLGALIMNLILGQFNLGFVDQPVAHNNHLGNFLGTLLLGFSSVLMGGCPIRQTVLSGQGDNDATITVLGLIVGAAFAHNFGLASSPKGVTTAGMVAVVICLVINLIIASTSKRSNIWKKLIQED